MPTRPALLLLFFYPSDCPAAFLSARLPTWGIGGPGDAPRGPLQLWLADAKTGAARPLLGARRLNTGGITPETC